MRSLDYSMSVAIDHRWVGVLASTISFIFLLSSSRVCAEQPQRTAEKSALPSSAAADPGTGGASKQTGKWAATDELPLLTRTLIRPIRDAAEFSADLSSLKFPRERKPLPPTEKLFEKDDDAVAAARAWITAHFGELPQGISLEVQSIDHSSSGRPKPVSDWDQGHTINFREQYHGIPTDGFAVIYITGRTKFAATVKLHTYSPIPGSAKRIIDKPAAVKAWQDRIKEKGYDLKALGWYGYEKDAKPRLTYVWSNVHYLKTHTDVIAPTWALDRDDKFMVDGHSGVAWLND